MKSLLVGINYEYKEKRGMQKIAGLLETKYVVPEMAKKYAEELKRNLNPDFMDLIQIPKNLQSRSPQ